MPKARARCATSCPIRPSPATPSVLPRSSVPRNFFFSHFPSFIARSAAGIKRARASMSAHACSATLMLFAPGALTTRMPRALAASARSAASADGWRPERASTIQSASARSNSNADGGRSSATTIFIRGWKYNPQVSDVAIHAAVRCPAMVQTAKTFRMRRNNAVTGDLFHRVFHNVRGNLSTIGREADLKHMPTFTTTKPPVTGTAITRKSGQLVVPDDPIIPFIEGDGTGPDIWRASVRVFDAAVAKAYGGKRSIAWMEVYAGEKSFKQFNTWLPDDTVEAFREYYVGIKGPLTTPVGGGIRSLNVALRQLLDLYVCLRPVRWYRGVPSPVRHPEKVDMVIFRENTEDIYAGIEYAADSAEAKKLIAFLAQEFPKDFKKIRFGS